MKILLTTDTVGGVWVYACTLARELVQLGHACFVAMIGEPSDAQLEALPREVERASRALRLEWMPEAADDVAAGTRWIEELAASWAPDVVHLNQFAYAAGRLPARTLVVAHSDVYSWYGEVLEAEPPAEWHPYRDWVRAGLTAADVVVAPTAYQSGLLARHYGRPADRVIANGVAPPRAGPNALPPSRRGYVLTAGRAWDWAKGVAVLDEALALLGDAAPATHLAGALEGPAGERYRPERLLAHGSVPRSAMDRLYENTSVYVATSLYEPFGLTPLEAAHHGCALLLSNIGSFRDLWKDTAVYYPKGNARWLADALQGLLDAPERLDELGRIARERAGSHYTARRMGEEYERLYGSLVAGRTGWVRTAFRRMTGQLREERG